jgi:hypothetical protein
MTDSSHMQIAIIAESSLVYCSLASAISVCVLRVHYAQSIFVKTFWAYSDPRRYFSGHKMQLNRGNFN